MKVVNKITKIVAKFLEVVHWVGAALMVGVAICAGVGAKEALKHFADVGPFDGEIISAYGFEVSLINMKALMMFAIGSVIIFILVAMIFRNIYLIMKKSEGTTPFQKDNVRMVREIGIFSIAIPVIGLIMTIITRLVLGVDVIDAVDTSVNYSGFVMGIIMLSLSQIFAYGVQLEKDVDGMV